MVISTACPSLIGLRYNPKLYPRLTWLQKQLLVHWYTVGYPDLVPSITTDKARNFESTLFKEFTNKLGCKRISTTSCHSQSAGFIEKLFYQTQRLKTSPLAYLVYAQFLKRHRSDLCSTCHGRNIRQPCDLINWETVNQPLTLNYVTE